MPGMLLLGRVFQGKEQWKSLSIYTWGLWRLSFPRFGSKDLHFIFFFWQF